MSHEHSQIAEPGELKDATELADSGRRRFIAVSTAAAAAGLGLLMAGGDHDEGGKDVAEELSEGVRQHIETGRELEELLSTIENEDPEVAKQLKDALANIRSENPEAYQNLLSSIRSKVEHKEHHGGADALDWVGSGVFFHGLTDILHPKIGHVTSKPYTELLAVWILKYALVPGAREHLKEELMTNAWLIPTIVVLVTIGENTGFDIRGFKEKISQKLATDKTFEAAADDVTQRGEKAKNDIEQFMVSLRGEIEDGKSYSDAKRTVLGYPQFSGGESQRVLKYFVEKEMEVSLKALYLNQGQGSAEVEESDEPEDGKVALMDKVRLGLQGVGALFRNIGKKKQKSFPKAEEDFYAQWLCDETNSGSLTEQVTRRFDDRDKVKAMMEVGAGSMTFASATSPAATTVATAAINGNSGMTRELTGEPSIGFPEANVHFTAFDSKMPPFETRIMAQIEDHVHNLSGLGGVGDPPFLAVLKVFGWKGFVAQTLASFPSTYMNAVASYSVMLSENFPFLGPLEVKLMAEKQLRKLVPEYLELFGSNLMNTVIAMVEVAGMGASAGAGLGAVAGGLTDFGAGKGALAGAGLGAIAEMLGLAEPLKAKFGPVSTWKVRSGIQYSFKDVGYEVWDELKHTAKPDKGTLSGFLADLQQQVQKILERTLDTGEPADAPQEAVVDPLAGRRELSETDIATYRKLKEKFISVNGLIEELWDINTMPTIEGLNVEAEIERLQDERTNTASAAEKHDLTGRIHQLIRLRTRFNKTPDAKARIKQNKLEFAGKREQAEAELAEIAAWAEMVGDKSMRMQILHFVKESKMTMAKLMISQVGLVGGKGNHFDRMKAAFDMENMQNVFGHSRAEVLNILTFQAHCVPFLTATFKEMLGVLPKSMRPVYIVLLFGLLNVFSAGADNLVATLVGLGIDSSLWPYVLQASIDGGKNSRIGNMANLAGVPLKDFPLAMSLSLHMLTQRMKKAGLNLAYAGLLHMMTAGIEKQFGFKLVPIESDEHAAALMKKFESSNDDEEQFADSGAAVDQVRRKIITLFQGGKGSSKPKSGQMVAGDTFEDQWKNFVESHPAVFEMAA